jgi:RNA polymerase sigma-70 factor (ECF subfamily)
MDRGLPDEKLLTRFAQGDRAALGELAKRYERALLGLAGGLLNGSSVLAGDAVQETWLRVIRFADRFDGRSSFKTWLYRIAINQCHSLRANGRATAQTIAGANAAATTSNAAPSAEPGPQKAAEAAESRTALRAVLESLAPEQRDVLLLCYHQGLTHQQAAEILELPVGTLKSRLHAALETLRGRLVPEVGP